MSGRATTANIRTGPATTSAVPIDAEMPRNWGSSSPKSMENRVTSTSARTLATVSRVESCRPRAPSGACRSLPTAGVVRKPRIKVVSVIPTCAADSWVDSFLSEARTEPALASPLSAAFCTAERSRATRLNSVATNRAVPAVSTRPARTINQSVIVRRS